MCRTAIRSAGALVETPKHIFKRVDSMMQLKEVVCAGVERRRGVGSVCGNGRVLEWRRRGCGGGSGGSSGSFGGTGGCSSGGGGAASGGRHLHVARDGGCQVAIGERRSDRVRRGECGCCRLCSYSDSYGQCNTSGLDVGLNRVNFGGTVFGDGGKFRHGGRGGKFHS